MVKGEGMKRKMRDWGEVRRGVMSRGEERRKGRTSENDKGG